MKHLGAKNTVFNIFSHSLCQILTKIEKYLANLDGITSFEKNFQGLSMLATNWISETCGTQEQFIYAHFENDFAQKKDWGKSLAQ